MQRSVLTFPYLVTLVNLATHNAGWGPLAERLCKRFGYSKVISATSGSEATDTAVKIARKWGIVKKAIPAHEMLIFGVGDSFHGLTSGVWSFQNSTKKRAGESTYLFCVRLLRGRLQSDLAHKFCLLATEYGLDSKLQTNVNPSTGKIMAYCDIKAMEECLAEHHGRVSAVIMECLHGAVKYVNSLPLNCLTLTPARTSVEIKYSRGRYSSLLKTKEY